MDQPDALAAFYGTWKYYTTIVVVFGVIIIGLMIYRKKQMG